MNRRTFLKYLAALPLVGTAIIKAKPAPDPPSVGDAADFGADFFSAECRYPLRDARCQVALPEWRGATIMVERDGEWVNIEHVPTLSSGWRNEFVLDEWSREVVTYRDGKLVRG